MNTMRPFTTTIPFAEALRIALDATRAIDRAETVPLSAADGRVAAETLTSSLDVPSFDRSAMDGYAVRSTDAAAGAALTCVGVVHAGEVFAGRVGAGECVEISTGAPLPAGADAVVMVEETSRVLAGVTIRAAAQPGQNIGRRGADIANGAPIVSRGDMLTPARVGALAATGHTAISVLARPHVVVVSTGNEVVSPGLPLPPGHVYDVNRYTLESVIRAHGGLSVAMLAARDSHEALAQALDHAVGADLVIFSGGSSVGERDLVRDLIAARGEILFHGIAVKPGKPTAFGRVFRTGGGHALFFGMPGNPTSCLSNAYILLLPVLRRLAGLPAWQPRVTEAPLARAIQSASDRHQFYTVRLGRAAGGGVAAEPAFKGSGDITSMANADGYIEIPAGTGAIAAGTVVRVIYF